MPRKSTTNPVSEESRVSGELLGLPLVSSVTSIRSQSASRITWHQHGCYELLLLLDGSTAYEFSDGRTVELPGGHFMVIQPEMVHRGFHDVRRPVRLTGIMFDPNAKGAYKNSTFSSQELNWLHKQFDVGAMQSRHMGSELRSQMKSFPQDFADLDLTSTPIVASIRLKLCAIILEAAKQLTTVRIYEPKQTVQSAIRYMESHLTESTTIQEIAEHVHCSRARLFQVFKDSTGLAPNDYWQRLRIDAAQALLSNSNRTITEIALDCGFTTSQYFSSVFRRYCGVTPTEYRNVETALGRTRTTTKSNFNSSK